MRLIDEATAAAQQVRSAADASAAAPAASRLAALTGEILDRALQDAQSHLALVLKAEGLVGAPR